MAFDGLVTRRGFLKSARLAIGGAALPWALKYSASAAGMPAPKLQQGIQIGDVQAHRAVIWSRSDRPARLLVDYDFTEQFSNPTRVRGPFALEPTDYTARVDLTGLPDDSEIFLRVMFQDLSNERNLSEAVVGRFHTAPRRNRDIRFLWSGDTVGQGWGINPEFGGMKIYETMRLTRPDFFIHCGDTIYADGPIQEAVTAENGQVWRNIVTPEVAKVAETLEEFRGRYKYNLLDDNLRRFNAEVPQIWQWDDHEVVNNWSPSKNLTADPRYTEKDVPLLVSHGTRAFLEYAPMRYHGIEESERVYRLVSYGRLLDVFVLDMRSYRAGNSFNRQAAPGAETVFLGAEQIAWLKERLRRSDAVWKVIASDMPLGLQIGDGTEESGRPLWENAANGDGPVLGREFEIADILRFIKHERIHNVVWLTADVHYCAAHYYDPRAAQFKDFEPFWEFVAGPLNAGSFGPNALDNTFGPQVVFEKSPPAPNFSPFAGLQFFGQVDINGRSEEMTVRLKDIGGNTLFSQRLRPSAGGYRHFPL
jgi:alkaline phosphatase D